MNQPTQPKLLPASRAVATALLMAATFLPLIAPLSARAQTPLVVPVAEAPVLPVGAAEISTAASAAYLKAKSLVDVAATQALKTAIGVIRDMVLRWIITGRFEGPVFVTSFTADSKQIAENAARIFLSDATGINFCSFFGPPSVRQLTFAIDLGLACSVGTPGQPYDLTAAYLNPAATDEIDDYLLSLPQNSFPHAYGQLVKAKAEAEARAVIARSRELAASQGFLGIRDPETGKITTPGSYVAELIMQSQIVSPIRQTDVAKDIQTAIAKILDTAIRTSIERGLSGAFER